MSQYFLEQIKLNGHKETLTHYISSALIHDATNLWISNMVPGIEIDWRRLQLHRRTFLQEVNIHVISSL